MNEFHRCNFTLMFKHVIVSVKDMNVCLLFIQSIHFL